MPLDKYLLNPAQQESVFLAYSTGIAHCMRKYGYEHPVSRPVDSGLSGEDAPKTRVDGRFGFQSMTHARKWGYHPAGGFPDRSQDSAETQSDADRWFALTGARDLNSDFGPGGTTRDGHKVRSRGCVGDSVLRMTGARDGVVGDSDLATELKFQTLADGQKDKRTLEVFERWSLCMREREYSYRTPLEALSDARWAQSAQPSSEETDTAVADQKCRSEHNVVGVWFAVDYEYQERAVEANLAKLREVKTQLTRQVRAAHEILDESR
ncbi:hypothetical protein STRCI_007760 [Streptomyces cinnabarinus]|uniref:Uncharacterized protein n=1 Tax=Streptomyces cinnabarinus TaxID=67287 RepID=A0ABY7KNR7_9ACTN|nr:hypothetical protein [Streptomyces cinnabarinus]WAZ26206.1 hypothetical protein STRCI_007760 [Streptomyces cinnabarinus]